MGVALTFMCLSYAREISRSQKLIILVNCPNDAGAVAGQKCSLMSLAARKQNQH